MVHLEIFTVSAVSIWTAQGILLNLLLLGPIYPNEKRVVPETDHHETRLIPRCFRRHGMQRQEKRRRLNIRAMGNRPRVFLRLSIEAEKVYIVWDHGVRRLRSPVYLICLGTIILYVGVIVTVFLGHIANFRGDDGACVLGLKPTASLPLVAYDLYINILLTSLFMWRIFRFSNANPKLKRVAVRTLIASIAALTTSTVNIAILTVLKGREAGWLCLGSCGTDVIFNAAALFWVTTSAAAPQPTTHTQTRTTPDRLTNQGTAPMSEPQMSQRAEFKPFHMLRHKSTPCLPTGFQIHVTTTSDVATSPSGRQADLESTDGDVPYETKRNSDLDSEKTVDV
ncbi:hypothetical protein C8R44DRAFT_856456 [Mycena epipterygia]|nr:hypothetical protein C8R44DRAFT_856456 [Mycena epipterygia]